MLKRLRGVVVFLVLFFSVFRAAAVDWYVGFDYGNFEYDEDSSVAFDSGKSGALLLGFRHDDRWSYEIAFRHYDSDVQQSGVISAEVFEQAAMTAGGSGGIVESVPGVIGAPAYTTPDGTAVDAVTAVSRVVGTRERLALALQGLDYGGVTFTPPVVGEDGSFGTASFVQNVTLEGGGLYLGVARSWAVSDSFDVYAEIGYDSMSIDEEVTLAEVTVELASVPAVPAVDHQLNDEGTGLREGQDPPPVAGVQQEPAISGIRVDTSYAQSVTQESGAVLAVGAEWKVSPGFSLNAEYELSDLNRYSVGFKYFLAPY